MRADTQNSNVCPLYGTLLLELLWKSWWWRMTNPLTQHVEVKLTSLSADQKGLVMKLNKQIKTIIKSASYIKTKI